MVATVLLCVLSSLSFCLCARGLVAVTAEAGRGPVLNYRRGFSARARRFARSYVTLALTILALASLFGAFSSYIELFSLLN